MKKFMVLAVVLLMTAIVTTGYAQVRGGSFTFGPNIGGYKFEGSEDLRTSLSLGLRGGYNFTKYIGIEGFVHYVPTGFDSEWMCTGAPVFSNNQKGYACMKRDEENLSFFGYGIEGLFHFFPDNVLVPFVAVGIGGVYYSKAFEDTTENKHSKFAADYGAGLKYFLTENVALRGDVRHVIPFDSRHNDLLYTVGLSFAFGGTKKVEPVAAPVAPPPPAPVVAPPPPPPPAPVVVEEAKPQAAAAPEIVEKGRTTLHVLFDFDKAIIKKNSLADVDNLIAVMKQYPELNVVIEGHTCTRGTAAYNKKLSQRRADAVRKYMVDKGIDSKRLTAKGFGFDRPIASNKTEAGRIQNRRVEAATAEYTIKK